MLNLKGDSNAVSADVVLSSAFVVSIFRAFNLIVFLSLCSLNGVFSASALTRCDGLPVKSFVVLGFLHRLHSFLPLKL